MFSFPLLSCFNKIKFNYSSFYYNICCRRFTIYRKRNKRLFFRYFCLVNCNRKINFFILFLIRNYNKWDQHFFRSCTSMNFSSCFFLNELCFKQLNIFLVNYWLMNYVFSIRNMLHILYFNKTPLVAIIFPIFLRCGMSR